MNVILEGAEEMTYNNSAFAPTSIPMPTDEAQPVALAPDTRSNRDLRVQLHTHLEIALELRRRDGVLMAHLRTTLETAVDHGVQVTLLGGFGGGSLHRGAVDSFVEDWVVGVMFLHGA